MVVGWDCHAADYINFVFKFPNFRYRGNKGWSEVNYIAQLVPVTFADPRTAPRLFGHESRTCLLYKSRVMANFLVKFPVFRYRGTGVV